MTWAVPSYRSWAHTLELGASAPGGAGPVHWTPHCVGHRAGDPWRSPVIQAFVYPDSAILLGQDGGSGRGRKWLRRDSLLGLPDLLVCFAHQKCEVGTPRISAENCRFWPFMSTLPENLSSFHFNSEFCSGKILHVYQNWLHTTEGKMNN